MIGIRTEFYYFLAILGILGITFLYLKSNLTHRTNKILKQNFIGIVAILLI